MTGLARLGRAAAVFFSALSRPTTNIEASIGRATSRIRVMDPSYPNLDPSRVRRRSASCPPLRRQPVQVAREQRDLADVRRAGQPGHPALEPDREPAVRRHAVPERLEVGRVRLRGLARAPRAPPRSRRTGAAAGRRVTSSSPRNSRSNELRPARVRPGRGWRVERPLRASGSPRRRRSRCRARASAHAPSARSCAGARSGSSGGRAGDLERLAEVHDRDLVRHARARRRRAASTASAACSCDAPRPCRRRRRAAPPSRRGGRSMKPSSASSETYSARCRTVSCGSARNTGPTS